MKSLWSELSAWFERTWQQAPPMLRRYWPWFIVGGIVAGFLLVFLLRPEPPSAKHTAPGESEPAAQNGSDEPGSAGASGESAPPVPGQPPVARKAHADAGAPLSPNVKLTFRTFPQRRASVMWGAKRLGFTDRGKPLVVERPRDSGPLDVVVRSDGFLPVHARAYTFDDAVIDVRITPEDKIDSVYGYQQPLTDAGAPPPSATGTPLFR